MITGLTWLIGFQAAGRDSSCGSPTCRCPGRCSGCSCCSSSSACAATATTARSCAPEPRCCATSSLFFVPAGVGVVVYLSVLGRDALPIAVAMLGSWFLGLVVVAWTAEGLERLLGRPRDDLGDLGDLGETA
ncbi:CidA/LrgA family protein [Nocardioides convexus]|uniref:CidA/LrgA family protein n=1 Tax=Nocardioides convexus TaxID=2712224 RepID=UPI00241842AE|nr:CidA/LrgA family protein [Nocardioides convexus]